MIRIKDAWLWKNIYVDKAVMEMKANEAGTNSRIRLQSLLVKDAVHDVKDILVE